MSEHPIINISIEPIELCKLLKIANMVGGGGEAKVVISEGYVLVNNEVEFQKRKKIRHGDTIEFDGEIFEVAYNPKLKSSGPAKPVAGVNNNAVKKSKAKVSVNSIEQSIDPSPLPAKRRPISF